MKTHFCRLSLLVTILVHCHGLLLAQYTWTKDPRNPVMSGSGSGSWDKHVAFPVVLVNSDSNRYEMWYVGTYGPEPSWWPYRIGFAMSPNGITWNKHSGNPVLVPTQGSWDEGSVELGSVLRENGQYKLWYYGVRNNVRQIGYATSPDGVTWTKYANNPVFSGGSESWEAGGVLWCSVFGSLGNYTMYYTGREISAEIYRIGRATSLDGINWHPDTLNNPVLTIGPTGQWDDQAVCGPYCLFTSNNQYLWYTGWANNFVGTYIGLATSTNSGITWTKYGSTPVISHGPAGSWDADYVEAGGVVLIQDTVRMWYDGSRDNPVTHLWRIGLATSPLVPVSVDDGTTLPAEFALEQNHPNPFNPVTNIQFSIVNRQLTILKVYDVLGREVATLVNEVKQPGTYTVHFDASGLASGMYLYRLQSGNFIDVKKLILLK